MRWVPMRGENREREIVVVLRAGVCVCDVQGFVDRQGCGECER